ncbi:MAG: C40 family peptidase [Fibrobacter sp.]|jgi:cell wall-associated NlpC family hydrolase|nr:C40 family peptidase [Fibrobacter sp.]
MRRFYPIDLPLNVLKRNKSIFCLLFSPSFLKKGLICSILFLSACTMPLRTGYDRKIGDYKTLSQSKASTETESSTKVTEEKKKEEITDKNKERKPISNKKTTQVANNSSLEDFIKPWIGTRYKYGGSSRSGTDCSGYVMQIYKTKFNISLPHNAANMFKMGSAVKAGDLKEGDLVFFGNVWGINHVGIYLNKNRFTHASSSKGVTITPMEMDYWKSRYKGARRFVND